MKKVIFSLKSIALVAMASMAMVSCGGDDDSPAPAPGPNPNPEPTPGLTENFLKVADAESEMQFTWLGYESNKAVSGGDFLEQALNPQDPSKLYVVWRFTTMLEDTDAPEDYVLNWFATEVDQAATGNARYKLPFTTGSGTVRLQTTAVIADTDYVSGESDEISVTLGENFSYATDAEHLSLVMEGTLEGVDFELDVDHALDMLYYIDVDVAPAAKGVNVNKTFQPMSGKASMNGISRK